MLELAAVLALSQACAPSVAPETLAAIAHVESRFDPLAIGVNRGGPAPVRSRDAREAARTARSLLARGANIDLGLAQINSSNLDWLDLSVEDAFDPCRNLAAAATVLKAGYRVSGSTPSDRQSALRVALSRYNTGDARRGFDNGYVGRVEAAAVRLSLMAPPILRDVAPPLETTAVAAPPEPASPPAPPWDVFGRARAGVVVFSTSAEW